MRPKAASVCSTIAAGASSSVMSTGQNEVLRDVGRHGCETFVVAPDQRDPGARRAHRPGGRGADARAGARDDRDLAVETQIGAAHRRAFRRRSVSASSTVERVVERLLLERDAVDVAGALDADEAGEHVLADQRRLALERIAVAPAAAQLVSQELARLDHLLRDGPQRLLRAVGHDPEGDRRRGVAAAAGPARRVEVAVGDVGGRHRVVLGPVGHARAGSAPAPARALRVDANPELAHPDRVLQLVDLDGVAEHEAVRDGVAVGEPAVVLRAGRPALGAEELLVHVAVVALAPVGAGDDGEARADPAGALGQAVAGQRVGDRLLRRDDEALADIRRGDRAGVREASGCRRRSSRAASPSRAGRCPRCAGCPGRSS